MRRLAPRPLATAAEWVARSAEPATPLARVQRAWLAVAGERVSREAHPVAERGGTITVACRSATWAQELELLSAELAARLNDAVAEEGGARPVNRLRFVTRSAAGAP